MEKEILWKVTSTNRRWGISIVGPATEEWPAEGSLVKLGKFEGHETFEFIPGTTGQWILPCDDATCITGAVVIVKEDLQSNRVATIIVGGDFFVLKKFGYKRRSSRIIAYKRGQKITIPTEIMAVMGLIPCEKKPVVAEIPPFGNTLATALKKAGLR